MEPSNGGQQKGGGGMAAIAVLIIIGLLVGLYFAFGSKKKKDGGGEDSGAAGPVVGGGLSQTQTQITPPGANVELNTPTIFRNSWAAVIDAVGSIFLDQLKEQFEDKLRGDEDGKARASDAADRARADADAAARARADADAAARARADADAAARAQADADAAARARADADAAARARADADAAARAQAGTETPAAPETRADAARSVVEAETLNAQAAEEAFARDSASADLLRTDRRQPVVTDAQRAMVEKVRSLEESVRKGANTKALGQDFDDKTRVAFENGRVNAERGANAEAIKNADTRAANEATKAKADADAKASAEGQKETRAALDTDARAKAEEKVRTTAEGFARLEKPRPPTLLERFAKNRARGTLGSADTCEIVENGRPNQHPDTGVMDEDGPRSHPLDYNAPRSSAFGKMPSDAMKRSRQFIRDVGAKLQRSMAKNPTTKIEADVKAMVDSKVMARSSGKAAAKQAGMAVLDVIGKIDLASDLMMVVQVFCDAFFYGAFPDESTLITPETVKGIQVKSVKAQIDSTTSYNKDVVDPLNTSLAGTYSYARAQWPIVIGPLDDPSKHRHSTEPVSPKYPEYENQQRVQAEIDAVRENLLRTTFKDYWVGCFGLTAYEEIVADPNDSLVNYVENSAFETTRSDELYRQAYSSVCKYHGGVMYEDVRPADDPNWGGRPRFQCSWANIDLCETYSNNWITTNGRDGGNYGEWYTFDELNVSLSNITEAPPADKGIIGCHSTDKSTYRKACGIEAGHPLRANGKTGACIISSPAVASICNTNAGTYVSAQHRCVFSEKYCQSIGTCFDRTEKMCYLPGEAMFAVSMVFGTGGPREWIKVNGCNFASTPEDGFYDIINVTPLGLFTAQGQTFIADMLANHEHWNEGMKQTLGNPVMIAVVSSMAVVFAMGTKAGTKLLSKVVKEGKGKQTAVGLLVMAVAIGVAIGAMTLESQEEQNKGPPDPTYGPFASEYTVGGWTDNIGTSPPLTLGFNDGWVTKPIKAHTLTDWPQTLSPSKPVPSQPALPTKVQDIPTCDASPRRFYSSYNLDGAWQSGFSMSLAVKTYTQTHKPPVAKNLCYTDNKIRAGARATDNELFCMDPFPPDTYRDNINIGELAPDSTTDDTSRSYMTSRTWTDGVDPTTPQYPFNVVNDNSPSLWYYQLVYDKHNMVGMTAVTEDGVTYKKGYPAALWNTDLLRFYFLDSTIQDMRQYYCIQGLIDAPDGSWDATTKIGVDPKCWGYLNVAVPGYKYTPMTVPGLPDTSAATQTVLTTAAPAASQASTIAKSIPALDYRYSLPMITIFLVPPFLTANLGSYAIGDTLSDASATALGFNALNRPFKKIDSEGPWVAIISSRVSRTPVPEELSGPRGTVVQTSETGAWPSGIGDPQLRTLTGRLNLTTLLASGRPSPTAIATSIPAPKMITMFMWGIYSIPEANLGSYAIGDTLSDASATTLGYNPTDRPFKIIDAQGHWTAVISKRCTRTRIPNDDDTTGVKIIATQPDGTWPSGPYSRAMSGAGTDFTLLIGRLNLATLLA